MLKPSQKSRSIFHIIVKVSNYEETTPARLYVTMFVAGDDTPDAVIGRRS